MSYCGACGGFYNERCPHWPRCTPAPNPHDHRKEVMADTLDRLNELEAELTALRTTLARARAAGLTEAKP